MISSSISFVRPFHLNRKQIVWRGSVGGEKGTNTTNNFDKSCANYSLVSFGNFEGQYGPTDWLREGLLRKKNCSSFVFCPNYLPPSTTPNKTLGNRTLSNRTLGNRTLGTCWPTSCCPTSLLSNVLLANVIVAQCVVVQCPVAQCLCCSMSLLPNVLLPNIFVTQRRQRRFAWCPVVQHLLA